MKNKPYFILGIMIMLSIVLSACAGPIEAPTELPTKAPTKAATTAPTKAPTRTPTETPPEVPTEAPAEYGQIKIWNWNDPEFYLTYDKAKWEATEYDSLVSKLYSGCMIGANGFRNYGPDGPPPMTYESDTHFLADTEFSLELEIPKATGVADMIHVYWDDYAYQLALFPSTENYDECVAEFWEVMELSIVNNFGQ